MFRLLFLTFYGDCRADEHTRHHLHEAPASMTGPLVILAALSVVGGYVGLPMGWLWGHPLAAFLAPVFGHAHGHGAHAVTLELVLMAASVGIAVCGITAAYVLYVRRPDLPARLAARARGAYRMLLNKYFVDELYEATIVRPTVRGSTWLWRVIDAGLIDGLANGTAAAVTVSGTLWRRLQSGNVQHYALSLLLGAVAVLGYYVWR
jgi:NADH-quinone oxidoreductase subunit L